LKKALILAYDFPPYNSIGGQRPNAWLKYFNEFGIYPIVVTRHWDLPIAKPEDCYLPSVNRSVEEEEADSGTIIRVPFNPNVRDKLIFKTGMLANSARKVLSLAQLISEHRLAYFDNKRTLYEGAREFLQKNKVDVIIATGEPFILFTYANKLSTEFGIPWIGDYRDGWSTNYNLNTTGIVGKFQQWVMKQAEEKVIAKSILLTTAAPSFSQEIARLSNRKVEAIPVIYNGYFEEKFGNWTNVPLKNKFSIAHAGTLYSFQRVETFLSGLNLFLKQNPSAEVDITFYGLNFYPAQIQRVTDAAGSVDVKFTDKLPHDEMLKELASSHFQLLLATPEKHQVYAKVFDYIATGRPILMVENDNGPLEGILKKYQNATILSSAETVADYIEELFFSSDKQSTIVNTDYTFTRKNQTRRFAEIILKAIQ
jgi:glycosyltransferase involved in cell wall biosynthesis